MKTNDPFQICEMITKLEGQINVVLGKKDRKMAIGICDAIIMYCNIILDMDDTGRHEWFSTKRDFAKFYRIVFRSRKACEKYAPLFLGIHEKRSKT